MALRLGRSRVAVAAAFAPTLSLVACGLALGISDIPPVSGTPDAARDAGVDVPLVGQLPPRGGAQSPSTAIVNFAIRQLWLGETAQNDAFTLDPSAWTTFGYNIDGKVTTSVSTDVCTLAPNATSTVQIDGKQGADNSFGENIIRVLSLVYSGLSANVSTRIQQGTFTVLIDTAGLTLDPAQTNQGLSTSLFGGTRFPGTPTFTRADSWPVNPATLADGRTIANGAKISLSDSYITAGTFVTGHPTDFIIGVSIGGIPIALIIHQGVLTFQRTVDDAGASHAVSGMIAGILKESEIFTALSEAAATSGGTYCSALDALQPRLLAAQDIMLDGTNAPGHPCTGISVGFGFTADEIQPPSVVGPGGETDASILICPPDGAPFVSPVVDGGSADALAPDAGGLDAAEAGDAGGATDGASVGVTDAGTVPDVASASDATDAGLDGSSAEAEAGD